MLQTDIRRLRSDLFGRNKRYFPVLKDSHLLPSLYLLRLAIHKTFKIQLVPPQAFKSTMTYFYPPMKQLLSFLSYG